MLFYTLLYALLTIPISFLKIKRNAGSNKRKKEDEQAEEEVDENYEDDSASESQDARKVAVSSVHTLLCYSSLI